MFLAVKEMRRAPVRFGLLAAAIGLLLFLILFQQAIQQGLVNAFVGAVRNQNAPVMVYSVDGQRTLQGSIIPPALEQQVAAVDGVGALAHLGQGTFTMRFADGEIDAAIIGTDDATLGWPATLSGGRLPVAADEAIGSDVDFHVGDEVGVVTSTGVPLTLRVVGVATDVQLNAVPTLFTDLTTYEVAVKAVNPDATHLLPNVLLLRPAPGVSAATLVGRVDAAATDADAVTREVAADTTPGVAQVRQSFQVIFLLYGLVVPLVTGLFFLIVTLQKSRPLTLLSAIGAPARTLLRALLLQVSMVTVTGVVVGAGLYSLIANRRLGGIMLRYQGGTVVFWSLLFVALAIVGAWASLRRVLRIDPLEATVGVGGR